MATAHARGFTPYSRDDVARRWCWCWLPSNTVIRRRCPLSASTSQTAGSGRLVDEIAPQAHDIGVEGTEVTVDFAFVKGFPRRELLSQPIQHDEPLGALGRDLYQPTVGREEGAGLQPQRVQRVRRPRERAFARLQSSLTVTNGAGVLTAAA